MRDKFSELIDAGIASFQHKPLASEVPTQDNLCRLYNMYWGAATDTHMSCVNGERFITGKLLKDTQKWFELCCSTTWGAIKWSQSGVSTLGELFYLYQVEPQVGDRNGDYVINLVPCEGECDCPCCDIECTRVCTTESRFPVRFGFRHMINETIKNCYSIRDAVKNLNESENIPGEHWYMFDNKIFGEMNDKVYIIEMSFTNGTKINDEALAKLLTDNQLGDLYLVQYDKEFRIGSDHKAWKSVLGKCKFNSVKAKTYNELSPEEWLDEIKSIIHTIS